MSKRLGRDLWIVFEVRCAIMLERSVCGHESHHTLAYKNTPRQQLVFWKTFQKSSMHASECTSCFQLSRTLSRTYSQKCSLVSGTGRGSSSAHLNCGPRTSASIF